MGSVSPQDEQAPVIIHHLTNSRSFCTVWLLEELGVEYKLISYKRNESTNLAPPELKQVHPLGKSPVIEVLDDDGSRLVVAESGSIVRFLVEKYGKDRFGPPAGKQNALDYDFWLQAAEGSFMMYIIGRMYGCRVAPGGPKDPIIDQGPNLHKHFSFLDSALSKHAYIVGDTLSGADFAMIYPLVATDISKYPAIVKYVDGIKSREAWKRAEQKTEPIDIRAFFRKAKS